MQVQDLEITCLEAIDFQDRWEQEQEKATKTNKNQISPKQI